MIGLGQLWQHKGMEWLKIRAISFRDRPSNMVRFKVENVEDTSTHGVEIEFDAPYVMSNYTLIEQALDNPAWEV